MQPSHSKLSCSCSPLHLGRADVSNSRLRLNLFELLSSKLTIKSKVSLFGTLNSSCWIRGRMIRAPKDGSSVVTGNSGIGGRTNELLENLFFQIALKIMFCTSLSVSERLLYGFFVVFGREVYACSRSSLSFSLCA